MSKFELYPHTKCPCLLIMRDGRELQFSMITDALLYMDVSPSLCNYYADSYHPIHRQAYLFRQRTEIDRSRLTFEKPANYKRTVYFLRPDMSGKKFKSHADAARFAGVQNARIGYYVKQENKKILAGGWWFSEEQIKAGKADGSIQRMIDAYNEQQRREQQECGS